MLTFRSGLLSMIVSTLPLIVRVPVPVSVELPPLHCTKFPVVSSFRHLSYVITVTVLLVVPVPPLIDVIALVVLVFEPGVVACTDTLITQLPPAGIVPPLNERDVSSGLGVKVPPHPLLALAGLATTSPAGNVSVNATPVNATVAFGLVSVKVRADAWVVERNPPVNALVIVGGFAITTVSSANESGQGGPVEMVHLSTIGPAPPVCVKVELPA